MIPNFNTSQEIGTGKARIEAVDFPHGGAYDQMGRDPSYRGGYTIRARGNLIGTNASDLEAKYNALRAYLGVKDRLWRRNDSGSLYWVWARLENVDVVREEKHQRYLTVDLTFYVFSPLWNGDLHGSWRFDSGEVFDSGLFFDAGLVTALANTSTVLTITNGGNAVLRSFEFVITAKTSAITTIRIEKPGQTDLTWAGNLAAESSLVIDFGGLSIRASGVDAYNGLALSSANHKIDDWLLLNPGANEVTITRTGGGATSAVAVSYYDGWV